MKALVSASGIKEYVKAKDIRCSKDTATEADKILKQVLDRAVERARGNNRTTVKARDI